MPNPRRLPWLLVAILVTFSLVLVACGDVVDQVEERVTAQPTSPPSEDGSPAAAQATPPPAPTVVQIHPTDTPPPPPPTPTTLPTNTPAPESPEVSETEEAPTIASNMAEIPAGPFTLGNDDSDPNEAPAQEMDLPAFTIDAFEVSNADFATFVEATGYMTYREQEGNPQNWRAAYAEGKDNHPVVFVTFEDAQAFCQWAGKRLPTEFEWEKAARGPAGSLFPWGDEYDPAAFNGKDSGLRGTTAAGSYPANEYGLFDMAGNVKEWVNSPYVAYPGSDYEDSHYSPDFRGIRGGGWFDEADFVLSANRNGGDPGITANDDIGFRCVE